MSPKRFLFLLFFLFNFYFPKGGIKWGPLPLTFGYLLFFFAFLHCVKEKISRPLLWPLFCFFPFQAWIVIDHIALGSSNLDQSASLFLHFAFFPTLFFLYGKDAVSSIDQETFLQSIHRGVLFLSFYGIALFVIKWAFGFFLQIPFITINYHDFGLLESTKHINRSGIFKLISTYNNGNLFGVCLLMVLPLFDGVVKKGIFRWVPRVAALLTLSRTVWFGLLFHEIIGSFMGGKKRWIAIFIAVVALSIPFGSWMTFLLDPALGGRIRDIRQLSSLSLLPHHSFSGLLEMIYISAAVQFGVVGFALFMVAMIGPVLCVKQKNDVAKRALMGIYNFLFVSLSDGPVLLIPTMVLYLSLILLAIVPLSTKKSPPLYSGL